MASARREAWAGTPRALRAPGASDVRRHGRVEAQEEGAPRVEHDTPCGSAASPPPPAAQDLTPAVSRANSQSEARAEAVGVGSSALLGAAWVRHAPRGMAPRLSAWPALAHQRGGWARCAPHPGRRPRRCQAPGVPGAVGRTPRQEAHATGRAGPRTPPRPRRPRRPPDHSPYATAHPRRWARRAARGTAQPAHRAGGAPLGTALCLRPPRATRSPSQPGARPDGDTPRALRTACRVPTWDHQGCAA